MIYPSVECKPHNTRIVTIDSSKIGRFIFSSPENSFLEDWDISLSETSSDAQCLAEAVSRLQTTNIPVAFPTETVYGLGADATRTDAVLGIYTAKQRPPDNPLIVHISSLSQLRKLLLPPKSDDNSRPDPHQIDPIPSIYHSLIARFWPGPLTIILPLPTPSPFAPQATTSLSTVGVRMPSSLLALALIHLTKAPLAAPSANTSTKPSPTMAEHVLHDLSGRIELVIDGGPCEIGIESTVVDGLVHPPLILRPGGVSMNKLRECPGWEEVEIGYKSGADEGVPRAPGMKYRHYSPSAKVVLVEGALELESVKRYTGKGRSIGILRTKNWGRDDIKRGLIFEEDSLSRTDGHVENKALAHMMIKTRQDSSSRIWPLNARRSQIRLDTDSNAAFTDAWTIELGHETATIARGLFSALRELDLKGVGTIYVESIEVGEGDAAAAVMNRLRKAAEVEFRS